MPKTRSLKEGRVKIGQIIKANPKQVKQGTVLCGPAGLAVFRCGIRLTLLEGSDRWLLLAKGSKKPSAGSVSQISGPFRKGLAVCYYLVPSGQHIVTSIIQFLLSYLCKLLQVDTVCAYLSACQTLGY